MGYSMTWAWITALIGITGLGIALALMETVRKWLVRHHWAIDKGETWE